MVIPLDLRHALESGECVLFLGAGIGADLLREDGASAPNAAQLASEIADYFKVDTGGSTDLAKVAEVVEIRNHSRKDLLAFLQKRLADLTPTADLQWLFSRPYRAIFTTNYD